MKLINCIIYFFFLCNVSFAQFNTARYESNKKGNIIETKNIKDEKKQKNISKNWFQKLFNKKSKNDLGSSIDSLESIFYEKEKKYNIKIQELQMKIDFLIEQQQRLNKSDKKETPKYYNKVYMPLQSMFITSTYGFRKLKSENREKFHYGVDLRANYEKVYTVLDGVVKETGIGKKEGKYMKIKHTDKIETVYLHLDEIYFNKGEKVQAGWVVAKSGNTGKSTNPHLHFAVKYNGNYINPISFLNQLVDINNNLNLNNNDR